MHDAPVSLSAKLRVPSQTALWTRPLGLRHNGSHPSSPSWCDGVIHDDEERIDVILTGRHLSRALVARPKANSKSAPFLTRKEIVHTDTLYIYVFAYIMQI